MNNLRIAFRQLLKNPGFAVAAILSLWLGIGSTIAVFSVVNAVLLRPLAYSKPDELIRFNTEFPNFPNGGLRRFALSPPEYLDLTRLFKSSDSVEAWIASGVNVASRNEPARVTATAVTGSLLITVGAALGLLLAQRGLELVPSMNEACIPRASEISLDPFVFSFALVICLLAGLVFGITPIVHAAKQNLLNSLKTSAGATTSSVVTHRFRHGLVVAEIALASASFIRSKVFANHS